MTQQPHPADERPMITPVLQEQPTSNDTWQVMDYGIASTDNIRIYFYYDVLEELLFAANYRSEPCVAALLGNFSIDQQQSFVEVVGFDSLDYFFDWNELFATMKSSLVDSLRGLGGHKETTAKHLVGCFVHAPESQGKLTQDLIRVHLSLLNIPSQFILVMDAVSDAMGFYARDINGQFHNLPFAVVQSTSDGKDNQNPGENRDAIMPVHNDEQIKSDLVNDSL